MWLEQLVCVNFRSCRKIDFTLTKDDPSILIGINDCGKSSVLLAIGLLLSDNPGFNFLSADKKKSDISNSRLPKAEFDAMILDLNLPSVAYSEKQTVVLGKFQLEEVDVMEDAIKTYSNHMQWIIANRESDEIWILRIFDEMTPGVLEFALTRDYLEGEESAKLYGDTAANLAGYVKSYGISKAEIERENILGRFKNSDLVNAIYKTKVLDRHWNPYAIKKESKLFPEYRYLDWNITMETLQEIAKVVIKDKISPNIEATIDFAAVQASEAQSIVDTEFEHFVTEFARDLPSIKAIKSNIHFTVDPKLTDILVNKSHADGDIHVDSQGDGMKRQIWFALIKWKALALLEDDVTTKKYLWCFDEPETHLYPQAQREFFKAIKDIASRNVQVVVSTHSTVFVDRAEISKISKFQLEEGYTCFSKCETAEDVYNALQIRPSDFLFFDKFLVVEGDTESVVIPHLFKIFADETLISKGIQLVNLHGKDKRQENYHLFCELLKNFKKASDTVVYLFDNDVEFQDLTGAEKATIKYFTVGKQDFEDSVVAPVWHQIVTEKFGSHGINMSIEEIQAILDGISDDKPVQSNQKFYPKLRSELKRRIGEDNRYLVDDLLPDKGNLSGTLLCNYINDLDQVDANVKLAFEAIT